MSMVDARGRLNKLTGYNIDEDLQGRGPIGREWLHARGCPSALELYPDLSAAIDYREVEGKSDDELRLMVFDRLHASVDDFIDSLVKETPCQPTN